MLFHTIFTTWRFDVLVVKNVIIDVWIELVDVLIYRIIILHRFRWFLAIPEGVVIASLESREFIHFARESLDLGMTFNNL